MAISTTSGSIKGSDVLVAFKTRLVAVLKTKDDDDSLLADATLTGTTPVDETFVRIIAHPGPDYAEYRAERGISLCFTALEPFTPAGAGRYGLKTTRTLEVHVATQSHLDPAQSDQLAVVAHMDMEELIVDVLHDASPVGTPAHIGIKVRWIPGGADIARQVKRDVGTLFSVILFEVEHVPPLRVNISTSDTTAATPQQPHREG